MVEKMNAQAGRYAASLLAAYQQLLDEKPITCVVTNIECAAAAVPAMFVFDVSTYLWLILEVLTLNSS